MKILVFTGEAPCLIRGMMDEFLFTEDSDVEMVIVCNSAGGEEIALGPRAFIRRFPGESIFELRTRISLLGGGAPWIVLLEGHNRLLPGWLAALRARLSRLPKPRGALGGAVDNRTSTGPWSWANFIHTFVFHWRPDPGTPAVPGLANIALRSTLLPARRLRVGELEFDILPNLMATADWAPEQTVDHVQHRSWAGVTAAHWCNGRMTGALMGQRPPLGLIATWRHALNVVTRRMVDVDARLQLIPAAADLPSGTLTRVRWLAIAHAAGALWGSLFGPGQAADRLG